MKRSIDRMLRLLVAGGLAGSMLACNQDPIEPGVEGLELVYVSGHLGSYRDCPDKAFDPQGVDLPAADGAPQDDEAERPAPARDGDGFAADCAEEDCGPLNCQDAQLTVQLSNTSVEDAVGITVVSVIVLDSDGMGIAELPVLAVNEPGPGAEEFRGLLAADEEAQLRVDFSGPLNVRDLGGNWNEDGDQDLRFGAVLGAEVHLVIEAVTHEDAELTTPELYSLPEVDT